MGFEVFVPIRRSSVSRGKCAINSGGYLRICAADANAAGITGDAAVILIDAVTERIAIRAVRKDENVPVCSVRRSKSKTVIFVSIRAACTAIGHGGARGQYDLVHKDDLLIVNFAGTGKKKR